MSGEGDTPGWHDRNDTEHFRPFPFQAVVRLHKTTLDDFWLRDGSMEDSADLRQPDVLAQLIVEDLRGAVD